MRRQDKKLNMERVNKSFQDRANGKVEPTNKESKIIYVPDFYPELSNLMN